MHSPHLHHVCTSNGGWGSIWKCSWQCVHSVDDAQQQHGPARLTPATFEQQQHNAQLQQLIDKQAQELAQFRAQQNMHTQNIAAARAAGIAESDARTVAFEVGMQNGGMGTALAMEVLKSPSAALGPAIFGTWMNISGSTLASWWRERPPKS